MRKNLYRSILILLCLSLLAGCATASGKSLPLEDYTDPHGRYTFAIPEGWLTETEAEVLKLTPPDYQASEEELVVYVYTAPTDTIDTATHLEQAKERIEPFLSSIVDDDYAVVNEGQTKVDKYPAMLLDFAKPHAESYMLGRVVIVAMPFYVLVFVGKGIEADWEAFLPTYREMLKQFHLTSRVEPEGDEVILP